jgi:hypothetical protein
MPTTLVEWFDILAKVSAFAAAAVSIWNTRKIKEVHKLTNSLATRTEALAHSTGLAEGNLAGRIEQTAERKADAQERKDG